MPAPTITSRQNPLVARFKAAADHDAQWMLLEGAHLLAEALEAGLAVDCVAVDPDRLAAATSTPCARSVPVDRLVTVSRSVLDAMSPVRTPSGIVALAARPRHAAADVAHGGTRTAGRRRRHSGSRQSRRRHPRGRGGRRQRRRHDARRGRPVRMEGRPRFHGQRVSAAHRAGSLGRRDGRRGTSRWPAGGGSCRARAHADARVDFTRPTLIVLGSEGQGLPPALVESADIRVSIPMTPPVESLNVAVAAALLVYEARRQRAVTTAKARRLDDTMKHAKAVSPSWLRGIVPSWLWQHPGTSRHDRPRPLRRRRPLPHGRGRPGRAAGRADAAPHA